MTTPSSRSSNAEEMRLGYKMMAVAFQVTSEVIAGAGLGWLYDWYRGGGTIGVIVGGSIGVVVAMWTLIRQGLKVSRQLDEIEKRRRRDS